MKRRLLRVMTGAFATWLRGEMDPAGKASVHVLEARAEVLIDALPDGDPTLAGVVSLDEGSAKAGLDWLLTAMRVAYPDEWAPLAVETLRLVLRRNLRDVMALAQPPTPTVGERPRGP